MRVSRPTAPLARSADAQNQLAQPRHSVHGAQPSSARSHVGGGTLPPAADTVAFSDGTRISFRAVEELPELVD